MEKAAHMAKESKNYYYLTFNLFLFIPFKIYYKPGMVAPTQEAEVRGSLIPR